MDTFQLSHRTGRTTKLFVAFTTGILLSIGRLAVGQTIPNGTRCDSLAQRGEFGADLSSLAKFYTAPHLPDESNHYIEMWEGPTIREIATASGLTNNHALFINSHGKGLVKGLTVRYAYYPHEGLAGPSQNALYFSASDLAQIIGRASADKIHNIIIAGCDADRTFRAAELRKYFVNATNITHVAPGQPGYQPMFLQAFLNHSSTIQPLYETRERNATGEVEYFMGAEPKQNATKLSPYVADFFRSGERKPYRSQIAGRELLAPSSQFSALANSAPVSQ